MLHCSPSVDGGLHPSLSSLSSIATMLRSTLPIVCLSLAHHVLSQSSNDSIADGPGGLTLNAAGEYDLSQVGTLASDNNQTYMNPIMSVDGGDPWMVSAH